MTYEPDPRLSKQPLWVQDEVASLGRQLDEMTTQRDQLRATIHDGRSRTHHYRDDLWLPDGPIEFWLRADPVEDNTWDDRITVTIKSDLRRGSHFLEIAGGSGALAIRPQVTNVVRIGIEDY